MPALSAVVTRLPNFEAGTAFAQLGFLFPQVPSGAASPTSQQPDLTRLVLFVRKALHHKSGLLYENDFYDWFQSFPLLYLLPCSRHANVWLLLIASFPRNFIR